MTLQELATMIVQAATEMVPKDTGGTRGDVSPGETAKYLAGAWKDTFTALLQHGWDMDDPASASKASTAVHLACAAPLFIPPSTNARWQQNVIEAASGKAMLAGEMFKSL